MKPKYSLFYTMVGHTPVPADDIMVWAEWMEAHQMDRIVKKTQIGQVEVSTIFLGVDSSMWEGVPLLFETMIFGGKHNLYNLKASSWDNALADHEDAVKLVKDE